MQSGDEVAARACIGGFRLERLSGGLPGGESAIEHRYLGMTHGAEHPPGARGREDADAVIDHDQAAGVDAQRLDFGTEQLGAGQHMGQLGSGILDAAVEIEASGAGDLLYRICADRSRWRLHVGIQHHQIRVVEVTSQPVHRDQRSGKRECGHGGLFSIQ